jgi:hypothetical protein
MTRNIITSLVCKIAFLHVYERDIEVSFDQPHVRTKYGDIRRPDKARRRVFRFFFLKKWQSYSRAVATGIDAVITKAAHQL